MNGKIIKVENLQISVAKDGKLIMIRSEKEAEILCLSGIFNADDFKKKKEPEK